jgi:hypothetical protein
MRFSFSLMIVGLAAGLIAPCCWAANTPGQDAKPDVCSKGPMLLTEDFPGNELEKGWITPKGTWTVADGVLKGVEKAEDHHPAVISHPIKAHDLIAQFSFRFDGAKLLAFSLNNAKGHVCRAQITLASVALQKDKPNEKSDEKAVSLDKQTVEIKPGEWHTMVVTVCGKQMIASLDGKQVAAGSNAGVDVDKTSVRFPTAGAGVSLKEIRVWEAVPSESGAKTVEK